MRRFLIWAAIMVLLILPAAFVPVSADFPKPQRNMTIVNLGKAILPLDTVFSFGENVKCYYYSLRSFSSASAYTVTWIFYFEDHDTVVADTLALVTGMTLLPWGLDVLCSPGLDSVKVTKAHANAEAWFIGWHARE